MRLRVLVTGTEGYLGCLVAPILIHKIAEAVSAEFSGCELTFGPPSADNRSYQVGKIRDVLDFHAEWDVAAGAAQLHRVFNSIAMDPETFHGRGHSRLEQIEYLLNSGQVDERLSWNGEPQ